MRGITGKVVMLNLLCFRATADYSSTPERPSDGRVGGLAITAFAGEHLVTPVSANVS